MRPLYFLLFVGLLLASCNTSETNDNEHEAAIPDSDVMIETELSEEDKRKLANAKGKEASTITLSELNAKLENSEKNSALVFFWSGLGEEATRAFRTLKQLSSQTDSKKLDIILVHLGTDVVEKEVTALVRESGVDGDIHIMNALTLKGVIGSAAKWNEEMPAYYIFTREDRTGVWFDGKMDFAELYVMIQPFIM